MVAAAPAHSVSSFIRILILAVLATAIFAGMSGYFIGAEQVVGTFSDEQTAYIDGLVYGVQVKTERDDWATEFQKREASSNDARAFPGQRCAGKFFPDQPVAMKGCLAAQEPRPPKGYQYP